MNDDIPMTFDRFFDLMTYEVIKKALGVLPPQPKTLVNGKPTVFPDKNTFDFTEVVEAEKERIQAIKDAKYRAKPTAPMEWNDDTLEQFGL